MPTRTAPSTPTGCGRPTSGDAWTCPLPLKNLYVGAAGVVWGLDALRRRGLAVALRLAPDAALADDLHARVLENVANPANELMWGAPGTMLAARAMLDWTGDERWADAWRASADELCAGREPDGLWTQRLHGEVYRALGPLPTPRTASPRARRTRSSTPGTDAGASSATRTDGHPAPIGGCGLDGDLRASWVPSWAVPMKLVLLLAAAALTSGVAAAAPIPEGTAEPATVAKGCKAGLKRAVVGGKPKCLKVNQSCARRFDGRYHRYGFHCHGRRLTRKRPSSPPPSPPARWSAAGVQFHCMWPNYTDVVRSSVVDKLAAAGLRWIRIDVSWARIEDTGKGARNGRQLELLDQCVDMVVRRGLEPFVVVLGTPRWANGGAGGAAPPADASDFRDFMQWAAQRYGGRVKAWQIYNEPNNTTWTGTVAQYADVLKAGYAGVKAGDSSALVVTGGITFNDDLWVRELYANGAKDHFDALGTHPYPAKADEPPEHPDDGAKWWFTHTPAVRQVMLDNGDADAQIWITEYGYSAHANEAVPPGSDFWWALGVSEATQADYAVRALEYARKNWPYVGAFIWYKELSWPLGGVSPPWFDEHLQSYGLLRADQTPRPVYDALKKYLTGS